MPRKSGCTHKRSPKKTKSHPKGRCLSRKEYESLVRSTTARLRKSSAKRALSSKVRKIKARRPPPMYTTGVKSHLMKPKRRTTPPTGLVTTRV